MTAVFAALLSLTLLLPGVGALARPGAILRATYTAAPPAQIAAGGTFVTKVTLMNAGTDPWITTGPSPVRLSYHWFDGAGTAGVWDGARTPLGGDVAPGAGQEVQASVQAPVSPG